MAQLVEALRYMPEGRGFDSRWCHWIFFYGDNLSGRTMALGSTQPLTEMSNGKGKGKAIPLQAWTDPECSRRLRLPDFKAVGI